jgi:UDP-glucose 4-epimerase
MKDKRILITGGAGLVGSHIADLVAREQPREILIFDNFVRGRRENLAEAQAIFPLTVIEGDIRDRALLAKHFKGVDIVFHQAAIRIPGSHLKFWRRERSMFSKQPLRPR